MRDGFHRSSVVNQSPNKTSRFVAVVGWLIAAVSSNVARADAATERAELVRLIHELEALEPVIQQAEAAGVSTQRIRFQYGWLRGDLEKVKAGIREYLDTVPATPRIPPPLAGDYLR